MAKITANFSLQEFKCKDGTDVPNNLLPNVLELAKSLQALRDYIGKPIVIYSAYRTSLYNKKVGGANNSQHLVAKAGDLKVAGMTPKALADAIELLIKEGKMKQGGIGIYKTFTHYDIRGVKARW